MPDTKHPSHFYTEIVDQYHQYDEIKTKPINKLNLCFEKENDKCRFCIVVSSFVSLLVTSCILAWTIYMSFYTGDSSIEITQTTMTTSKTTTTLIEKIKMNKTSAINQMKPSESKKEDYPYLNLAKTDNNLIFFKPPENICFYLSRNGYYHISFSITLQCTSATKKEISITRKSKVDNKTDVDVMYKTQLCGTHDPSCFKQHIFHAKDGDWVCWKSNAILDKYDGNYVTLTLIEDPDKRKK